MSDLKILVVDDEVKLTEVIRSYLEKSQFQVWTVHNCKDARALMSEVKPDLMILDLMLPDQSGESFCKEVRTYSNMPIIMLTAKVSEADFLNGLEIGADDYMTKPFSVRQLVAKVQALLRRTVTYSEVKTEDSPLIVHGELELCMTSRTVKKSGELVSLTPSEFKILACLMGHPKKVFTRDELIERALGEDFIGFDRTVDSYIKNLRQKIEKDTKNPQFIMTVHGVGYRLGGLL